MEIYEPIKYTKDEKKIIDFLVDKYDTNEEEIIQILDEQEVDINELASSIYDNNIMYTWNKSKEKTKRIVPKTIEQAINLYCPVIEQILSWNSKEEYDFSKITDENTYNYEETPYPSWRVK